MFIKYEVDTHNRLTAVNLGYPGGPVSEETYTHADHTSPTSSTNHCILLVQFTCMTVLFHNFSPGPLVFLVVSDHLVLHTPYTSSPSLFATHARVIAACFGVVPVGYYVIYS